MSDEQRWKSKYLEALEQQETQERRWEARFDLLRRGLVRSSLAAEGSDKAVDQCMQELRTLMRSDQQDNELAALIPRLERAVLDSEQRRQQRSDQVAGTLAALAEGLQRLPLPRELRKPLKAFGKQVSGDGLHASELGARLAELGSLQARALESLEQTETSRPGFLQRLFGSRGETAPPAGSEGAGEVAFTLADANAPTVDVPTPPPSKPESEPAEPPAAIAAAAEPLNDLQKADSAPQAAFGQADLPAEIVPDAPAAVVTPADPNYALPPPEPGYSAIAPHVATSLRGLLDDLQFPDAHRPQAELLRERLQGSLNWYELVPVLDDLGTLVRTLGDSGERAFAAYLKQLNERLAIFIGGLAQARDAYSDSFSDSRALDDQLRQQVSGLQASVQQAADLETLKRTVENRLEGLISTMSDFQQRSEEREKEVGERLQTLVERVATMEQEAKGFQVHLEEQRQKALTDTLTGTPNRAAWSERLSLEEARWQRYGGDLLLAVLDIDHFKRINDDYGHLAGDKVLKIIAQEIQKRLRKTDFLARFGGEEFVILLPSTALADGCRLLDALRESIAACPFHFRGQPVSITFSAGITAFGEGDDGEKAFERADQALYRAKQQGRNQVHSD